MEDTTFLANATLQPLRALTRDGLVDRGAPLVPGTYFSWGAEDAVATVKVATQPDIMFDARITVNGAPDWLTLNLELGVADFHAGDVIGIVADLQGLAETEVSLTIRSAYEGKNFDTRLKDRLAGADARAIRTVLHTVGPQDALTRWGGFHTMLVHLPKRDCRLTLNDMRIFVLPAAAGLRSGPVTFADAGAS